MSTVPAPSVSPIFRASSAAAALIRAITGFVSWTVRSRPATMRG